MRVKDAGELVFAAAEGEEGTMSMTCDNTLFGINFAFKPAVPHTFEEDADSGVIRFTVSRDTDLIINFNYSQKLGGVYNCELSDVDDFPSDIFPDTVKQFGSLPQRRTYTFLLED